MTNNTTLTNGCEATYPYFEKEFTNGIIPLNNFPNLKYSTHPMHSMMPFMRMTPDLGGFWIDYFSNTDENRPGYNADYKDTDIASRIFMSMHTVTKIAETLFPFTIGGDKQAVLDIGARFPVFETFTEDSSSLEQMEVFDFNNDIKLEHFVPIEWIQYELAVHGYSSNWLHHWVYNLDDTYQSGKLLKFGVAINEKNDELAYDYLNKHIFLRVCLQRWLYTFVSTYLAAVIAPLRIAKEKAEKGDGLAVLPDEIKNIELIIKKRHELAGLIGRMGSFWVFKGDNRCVYGDFINKIASEHRDAILQSVR